MPPKQWIPVRFGARVHNRRFMKKDELKRDPVAEKLLSAVEYIKNNNAKIIGLIVVIVLIVSGIGYYQNSQNQLVFESKLAVDEVMLQLVNEGLNNPDYFNDKLSNQIDSIYMKYPNSKYINYLSFIVYSETSDSLKSQIIDKNLKINKKFLRPSKTGVLRGDISKAKKIFKYKVKTDLKKLIKIMMDDELNKYNI